MSHEPSISTSATDTVVVLPVPAERWEPMPVLPPALVDQLEAFFAAHGDVLYYMAHQQWHALSVSVRPREP